MAWHVHVVVVFVRSGSLSSEHSAAVPTTALPCPAPCTAVYNRVIPRR